MNINYLSNGRNSRNNLQPLLNFQQQGPKPLNFSQLSLEDSILEKQQLQWRVICIFLMSQCIVDLAYGLDQLRLSQANDNTLNQKIYTFLIAFSSIELFLILILLWVTNFINHRVTHWRALMTILLFCLLFGQVELMFQFPNMFIIKFITVYLIIYSMRIRQIIADSASNKICMFFFLCYVIIRHQFLLNFNIIILIYTCLSCCFMMYFSIKGDINEQSFLLSQQCIQELVSDQHKTNINLDYKSYNFLPQNSNFFYYSRSLFKQKQNKNEQQQPNNQSYPHPNRQISNCFNNYFSSNSNNSQEKSNCENIQSNHQQSSTYSQLYSNQNYSQKNQEQKRNSQNQNKQDKIFNFPLEVIAANQQKSPLANYQSQNTQNLNQIYEDILSLIPQGIALINNQREVVISNKSILTHFNCTKEEQLLSKIFSINKQNFVKSEVASNQSLATPPSMKRGSTTVDVSSNQVRGNRNSSFSSMVKDTLTSKKNSIQSDRLSIQKDRKSSILSQFKLKEMQSKRLSITNNKKQISELFDEILNQDLNFQYFDKKDDTVKNMNTPPSNQRRLSMNLKLGLNKNNTMVCEEQNKDQSIQFTVEKNVIQYAFHQGEKTFSLKIICCEMQQRSQTVIPTPNQAKGSKKNIQTNPFDEVNEGIQGVEPAILIITEDISNKILLQKLERLNKQKKRMVASISHELRTPLNCSIGLLDLLLQDPKMPPDLLQEYLMPALYSNRLLFNIVNDIIDFHQIDSGKFQLNFKIFDLRQLLDECAMLMKISVSRKNLQLFLDIDKNIPSQLNSDPQRIRQIVLNLLSNAVKYTFKGFIRIEAVNYDSQYIQIKVIDTGIGIKEESMNQIFEQFGRIQEEKVLETEGAGLGLTISMNLAKGVGGNRGIDVQSTFGKGSTFSFFILKQEFKKKGASMTKKEIFNKSLYQVVSHTQGMNSVELKDLSIDEDNQINTITNTSLSAQNGNSNNSLINIIENNKNNEIISERINLDKKIDQDKQINEDKYLLNVPLPQVQLNKSISASSFVSEIASENMQQTQYSINQPETQDIRKELKIQKRNPSQISQTSFNGISNEMIQDLESKRQKRNSNQITETSKEHEYGSISDSLKTKSINLQFSSSNKNSSLINQNEEETKRSPQKDFFQIEIQKPKIFINQFVTQKQQNSPVIAQNQIDLSDTSQEFIDQQTSSENVDAYKQINECKTHNQMKKVDCYEKFKSMSKNCNKLINQVSEKEISSSNSCCQCKKILVVEDNEFNLFLLKKMLQSCNLEADQAMNGQEAIDKVIQSFTSQCTCRNGYKLIFMDIDMPIKNGYEATQEILKYCTSNDIKPPLISACSAYVGEEDKKQALKEGMTFFITKPIEMKVLQSVLKKAQVIK
ncbi:ATPase, histidine kinase-, DNA gyrase B (macronuclear) [Tetrahymena thermophila SB210]|uniref:histidine kinase n=1 Tax=Tetrahymena thermophila (strain SB210) TaxID=312017 RepID=Q240L9_TETTS|nr:ATPase, histidine kinase-, DNA gyrase B [Tetrahymena thermophila SB210]EAS02189.2 ATPase, histidine kinase-, DNA gyrase B [Tetrahymena thermophila SB210]|eukprot:XP_001022434.2 ATPase, histidine kinase-, DNA gyrase B [Tetrahymena thermophila SB210]